MEAAHLQRQVDEFLPYFRIRRADSGTDWHLLYNGRTIAREHWHLFQQFTGMLGFPLDFSSSLYVGVTVSTERLEEAIQRLRSPSE